MEEGNWEGTGNAKVRRSYDIRDYWGMISIRRRWVVAVAALLMVGVGIYAAKAPRVYMTVARVDINYKPGNVLDLEAIYAKKSEAVFVEQQAKALEEAVLVRRVVQEVERRNAVTNAFAFAAKEGANGEKESLKSSDTGTIWAGGAWVWDQGIKTVKGVDGLLEDMFGTHDKRVIGVEAEVVPSTHLIDVKVRATDAGLASAVANGIVEEYTKEKQHHDVGVASEMKGLLGEEAREVKREMDAAEAAVQKFTRAHPEFSFENDDPATLSALTQVQGELDNVRFELGEIEILLGNGLAQPEDQDDTLPVFAANAQLDSVRHRLMGLRSELVTAKTRYRDEHPSVVRLSEQIKAVKSMLEDELRGHMDTLSTRMATLEERLRKLQDRRQKFLGLKGEFETLRQEVTQSRGLYGTLLSTMKEREIVHNVETSNIRVVRSAGVPIVPAAPKMPQLLVVGFLVSIGVGVGWALLLGVLDHGVKSVEDVETDLGERFLGYLPKLKMKSGVIPLLYAHQQPDDVGTEAFRNVRASMSLGERDKTPQVFGVTSAFSGEGKSFVATNLAISLAQAGWRTLLVDCDFRRPSLHKVFKAKGTKGLPDYLMNGGKRIEDVISSSGVPSLDVALVKEKPLLPSELIGSALMYDFLQAARQGYDRVILDCPPVMVVSDALLLNVMGDGVVVVTKFNDTQRETLARCMQRIKNAEIPILGVVSNYIDCDGRDRYFAQEHFNEYYGYREYVKPKRCA